MSRTPTISIGEQSQRGAWTGQCKALPFLGKRGAKNVKTLRNDGCAPPSEQLRNCLQELFAGAIHSNYSQKHYRTIAGTRVAATTIWVALLAAVRPGGYVRASNPNSGTAMPSPVTTLQPPPVTRPTEPRISCVVPAYNEAANLRLLVPQLSAM